jgi:hypothetical protein
MESTISKDLCTPSGITFKLGKKSLRSSVAFLVATELYSPKLIKRDRGMGGMEL